MITTGETYLFTCCCSCYVLTSACADCKQNFAPEKRIAQALNSLGQDLLSSAETLGVKVASLEPVRAKLIKKGMFYCLAHGDMAFTATLFDEFMVRAVPSFKR
jgi:hypothetical protein